MIPSPGAATPDVRKDLRALPPELLCRSEAGFLRRDNPPLRRETSRRAKVGRDEEREALRQISSISLPSRRPMRPMRKVTSANLLWGSAPSSSGNIGQAQG